MRHFQHAVLERHYTYTAAFATEPYEVGWASEAIFFLRIHQLQGDDAELQAAAQLSPDGVTWIDQGQALPPIRQSGLHFLRVRHFGGWLRLNATLLGQAPRATVTISLDLKE